MEIASHTLEKIKRILKDSIMFPLVSITRTIIMGVIQDILELEYSITKVFLKPVDLI